MSVDWTTLVVDLPASPTLLELFAEHMGITLGADPAVDAKLGAALNISGPVAETWLDRVVAQREVEELYQSHFGTVVLHNPMVAAAPAVAALRRHRPHTPRHPALCGATARRRTRRPLDRALRPMWRDEARRLREPAAW